MSEAASPAPGLEHARETLRDLREQIRDAGELDAGRRSEVLSEIEELEALLAEPSSNPPAHTANRLEELALEFELSHPAAAQLLNRLSNLFASMGI